jgi:mono/diheme cytochrome c family protein
MTSGWLRAVIAAAGLAPCLAGGCADRKWPASMEEQPSLRPLAAPRPAPEGARPIGGVESLEDREDVQDLKNPYADDPGAGAAGERLFKTHCVVCHGPEGHGDGKISTKFPPAPDLRYITICRRSDGFIYGTITAGGRAMPTMREGLTSRERWALVAHVRRIEKSGCLAAGAPQ